MDELLRRSVWQRAGGRCEYCQLPHQLTTLPHEVDHVVARKHGGLTIAENLCLACYPCNAYKGPNIAGIDPETGELYRLFHPRQDAWSQHFHWDGPVLVGITPVGRTTIAVLGVNLPERVQHRRLLIAAGVFPPP
jgi:hypothetical protein